MRDRVALLLAMLIAAFVLLSLIAVFVLSLAGRDLSDQWGALFALATAILGALGGWLGRGAVDTPTTNTDPPEDQTP